MASFTIIINTFAADLPILLTMIKSTNCQPADEAATKILSMIKSKEVLPGERIPSERKLSEKLGVGRNHVRQAIKKLETYGIVETYPQSGTVVSEFTKKQLDNVATDALKMDKYDLYSLVHVRVVLEVDACQLAAKNRTIDDLDRIERSLRELEKYQNTDKRVQKDFAFHYEIVKSSHNPVLASLFQIITPDIMNYYHRFRFCSTPERQTSEEHLEYLAKLKEQDAEGIKDVVIKHLTNLINFAKAKRDTSDRI